LQEASCSGVEGCTTTNACPSFWSIPK
jgi:hypothetical protein